MEFKKNHPPIRLTYSYAEALPGCHSIKQFIRAVCLNCLNCLKRLLNFLDRLMADTSFLALRLREPYVKLSSKSPYFYLLLTGANRALINASPLTDSSEVRYSRPSMGAVELETHSRADLCSELSEAKPSYREQIRSCKGPPNYTSSSVAMYVCELQALG